MVEIYEDPAHIDKCIFTCIQRLKTLNAEYREAIEQAAEDEATHDIGYAQARTTIRDQAIRGETKVTEGTLADLALAETENSYREHKLSKARADAIRQSMLSVRSQLDAFRSLAANHRELGGS